MTELKTKKRSVSEFRADVLSGFATGLFSVPEGMAYAQIAGVNPVYGLYSGVDLHAPGRFGSCLRCNGNPTR
jgi:MFS superfamily sulfate permease-like transporter